MYTKGNVRSDETGPHGDYSILFSQQDDEEPTHHREQDHHAHHLDESIPTPGFRGPAHGSPPGLVAVRGLSRVVNCTLCGGRRTSPRQRTSTVRRRARGHARSGATVTARVP